MMGIIKSVGLSVRKILKTVTFEPTLRLFIISSARTWSTLSRT